MEDNQRVKELHFFFFFHLLGVLESQQNNEIEYTGSENSYRLRPKSLRNEHYNLVPA